MNISRIGGIGAGPIATGFTGIGFHDTIHVSTYYKNRIICRKVPGVETF
jgi:hypothetical protein